MPRSKYFPARLLSRSLSVSQAPAKLRLEAGLQFPHFVPRWAYGEEQRFKETVRAWLSDYSSRQQSLNTYYVSALLQGRYMINM